VLDERLADEMKITVIATGFDRAAIAAEPVRTYPTPQPPGPEPRLGGPTDGLRRDDVNVPAFMRKKAD